MPIQDGTEDKEHRIATTFADTAVMAALISLQTRKAADQEGTINALRDWVHKSLASVYGDDNIPESLKSATLTRVDSIFDVALRLKI